MKGVMAYLLMPISSLVLLLTEKEDRRIRFHAFQGLIVGVALILVNRVFLLLIGIISGSTYNPGTSFVTALISIALGVASIVIWAALVLRAYQGTPWRLPVVGDIADQQAGGGG
jgi:uncharacterized membrane protein